MPIDIQDLSPDADIIGKRVSISRISKSKVYDPVTGSGDRTWVGILKSYFIDDKFFGFILEGHPNWIQITRRNSTVTLVEHKPRAKEPR